MTGLEKMVSQILEEADASAAVMISDAEKKAAEILGEAGEKADKIRQQREEQSRAKVKSYEERTASAADMKKRTAVLAAKQELIGKVIADACDRVKNLDEGKYFEILKSMAEKYLLQEKERSVFQRRIWNVCRRISVRRLKAWHRKKAAHWRFPVKPEI